MVRKQRSKTNGKPVKRFGQSLISAFKKDEREEISEYSTTEQYSEFGEYSSCSTSAAILDPPKINVRERRKKEKGRPHSVIIPSNILADSSMDDITMLHHTPCSPEIILRKGKISKRKKNQKKDDRIQQVEKEIEASYKTFKQGAPRAAKLLLRSNVELLQGFQPQTIRSLLALACANYYLSLVEYCIHNLTRSEMYARDSLELLDEIIIEHCASMPKIRVTSGSASFGTWVLGLYDPNLTMIWIYKSNVEYQMGSIMAKSGKTAYALEWFQRAIRCCEKQAHIDADIGYYISMSSILFDNAKLQFNMLTNTEQGELALSEQLVTLLEAQRQLAIAKQNAKLGVACGKKLNDDVMILRGLNILFGIEVLKVENFSIQKTLRKEYFEATDKAILEQIQELKIERLRSRIEKVQRRIMKGDTTSEKSQSEKHN